MISKLNIDAFVTNLLERLLSECNKEQDQNEDLKSNDSDEQTIKLFSPLYLVISSLRLLFQLYSTTPSVQDIPKPVFASFTSLVNKALVSSIEKQDKCNDTMAQGACEDCFGHLDSQPAHAARVSFDCIVKSLCLECTTTAARGGAKMPNNISNFLAVDGIKTFERILNASFTDAPKAQITDADLLANRRPLLTQLLESIKQLATSDIDGEQLGGMCTSAPLLIRHLLHFVRLENIGILGHISQLAADCLLSLSRFAITREKMIENGALLILLQSSVFLCIANKTNDNKFLITLASTLRCLDDSSNQRGNSKHHAPVHMTGNPANGSTIPSPVTAVLKQLLTYGLYRVLPRPAKFLKIARDPVETVNPLIVWNRTTRAILSQFLKNEIKMLDQAMDKDKTAVDVLWDVENFLASNPKVK